MKNNLKYLKLFELNKGVKMIQIFGVTQICSVHQHSWVRCYCPGAVSSPVVFNITSAVVLKASDSCRHLTSDTAVFDTSLKTHTNAQKTKRHIQLGVREQFHIQTLQHSCEYHTLESTVNLVLMCCVMQGAIFGRPWKQTNINIGSLLSSAVCCNRDTQNHSEQRIELFLNIVPGVIHNHHLLEELSFL